MPGEARDFLIPPPPPFHAEVSKASAHAQYRAKGLSMWCAGGAHPVRTERLKARYCGLWIPLL